MQALLDERPHDATDKRVSTFTDMVERIEAIKRRTAHASADHIRAELITLKRASPTQYEQLRPVAETRRFYESCANCGGSYLF